MQPSSSGRASPFRWNGRRPEPLTNSGSDTVTIGHRGSAGLAPENTVAGIELAHEHGPDFIEIDVQLSADGVPVMMHDTTLARTTDVANVFPDRAGDPVNSFTHDELQQLDAGSWFSDEFAGEKIPTLHEVLEAAHPVVGVVIELKSPELSPGLVDVVVDELESDPRWDELADDGRLTAISFDLEVVHDLYEQRPDIPVMGLGAVPASDAELESIAAWATSWGTNYRTLDPADVQRVHDAGMLLNVYTVNSPDHMDYVLGLGVDMITSDFPGVLEDPGGSRSAAGGQRHRDLRRARRRPSAGERRVPRADQHFRPPGERRRLLHQRRRHQHARRRPRVRPSTRW